MGFFDFIGFSASKEEVELMRAIDDNFEEISISKNGLMVRDIYSKSHIEKMKELKRRMKEQLKSQNEV